MMIGKYKGIKVLPKYRKLSLLKLLMEVAAIRTGLPELNKAGLEPEYAKVVCVSFGTLSIDSDGIEKPRFISFYGENEKEILEKSNKVFTNASAKGMKIS